MKVQILSIVFGLSLFLVSCSDNDNPKPQQPASQYVDGIFVTNEGGFGDADGSLTFISSDGEVFNSAFTAANPGKSLGDVVQSSYIADSLLFVVVNNSNKVEVMNLNDTLKSIYTLANVSLPRYMVTDGINGYVTEWVSFSDPGRVTIFNIQTGNVMKSIETDFGAERVLVAGGKVFVSNNFSNTVSIIDQSSQQLITNLEVGSGPAGLVVDVEGDVWVLCSGGYDDDYNPLNNGKLVEITVSDGSVKKEIELGINTSNELQFNHTKSTLYYYSGTSVFAVKTSANEAPEEPLFRDDSSFGFYGMGVGKNGKIYMADAKDFVQNGEVYVYSATGDFEKKFTVGRIPNGFSFN